MEARYLLDTNICIYIQRDRPEGVLRRFQALRAGEAALSVITFGELLYGAATSKQSEVAVERLKQLTSLLPILPIPMAAAEWFGAIRAELERSGQMIGNNDLWIAATALRHELPLVTSNHSEFSRIRRLRVLRY